MRYLLLVILAGSFAAAQTTASTHRPLATPQAGKLRTPALTQCQSSLNDAVSAQSSASAALIAELAKDAKLEGENKELAAKNTDLEKKLDESRIAAADAARSAQKLQDEYVKAVADRNELADRFNLTIQQMSREAQAQEGRISEADARARRLAALGMLRKTDTVNVKVTDCTKLPALCVGQ